MYADPKYIKKHRATTNLDDNEHALIKALVAYTGLDESTVLRQLAIIEARETLESILPQQVAANEFLLSN